MKVSAIYVSPGHNFFGRHGMAPSGIPMVRLAEAECVAGRGLRGDRFFDHKDDYRGQITFFAWETYEHLCQQLGVRDKEPDVFRRNVITRGADLAGLIGQEFEIQGVRFLGTEESRPCHWMNTAFGEGAEDLMRGSGGLRAKILTSGTLRVDDKD